MIVSLSFLFSLFDTWNLFLSHFLSSVHARLVFIANDMKYMFAPELATQDLIWVAVEQMQQVAERILTTSNWTERSAREYMQLCIERNESVAVAMGLATMTPSAHALATAAGHLFTILGGPNWAAAWVAEVRNGCVKTLSSNSKDFAVGLGKTVRTCG